MGVVYKVKEEVASFIIGQKKEDPKLSCRKMVDLVWNRFQIKVSKSAINTIIKNFNLSSPIGRRARSTKKTKKYRLPAEKIKQILPKDSDSAEKPGEDIANSCAISEQATKPEKIKPVKKHVPFTPPTESHAHEGMDEGLSACTSCEHSVRGTGGRDSAVQEVKDISVFPDSILYDGMGCFFLKAAEWEISDSPVFGSLLKKYIKTGGLADLDAIGGILQFLQPFGMEKVDDLVLYKRQGLWVLNGLKEPVSPEILSGIIKEGHSFKDMVVEFFIEIQQIFTELTHIKVFLEDGSSFCIDAEFSCVWAEEGAAPFSSPVSKVMTHAVEQIITNVQSAVFCSAYGTEADKKAFFYMIAAFENIAGKRMTKISLFNSKNQEIADFSSIPNKKRSFVCAFWPWDKEFVSFVESEKIAKVGSLYVPQLQKEVFFREIRTKMDFSDASLALRGILLRDSLTEPPFMSLITNALPQKMRPEDVILSYLDRWPNLEGGYNLSFVKSQKKGEMRHFDISSPRLQTVIADIVKHGFPTGYDILDLSKEVFNLLNIYCQDHFFAGKLKGYDVKQIISSIYGLSGYLTQDKKETKIHFSVKCAEEGILKDLEVAMKRINERGIRDYQGRKVGMVFAK